LEAFGRRSIRHRTRHGGDIDHSTKLVIRIEPNMAFGTARTRRLNCVCRRLRNIIRAGESFLDVGTGTGILAIAAAKLNSRSQIPSFKSPRSITDVDSVSIAKENANPKRHRRGDRFRDRIAQLGHAVIRFRLVQTYARRDPAYALRG
jgi:ribosomal protein L11 methylase PrmA